MKKSVMKGISLSTVALIIASIGVPSIVTKADTNNYESNGQIIYEASKTPTNPVDPQNPMKPVEPIDPTNPDGPNPGTAGPLSIDYASSFDFGTQEIRSEDKTYFAKAQALKDDEKTRTNYVQVTDNRGSLEGWSLNVEVSDFNNPNETKTDGNLHGVQLTLSDAELASVSELPADYSRAETVLDPNIASPTIMGASAGHGVGTNLLDFGGKKGENKDKAVKLFVPGKSSKSRGKYTAKLTWTLSEIPSNAAEK